jgi:aryl-alcohol dehydrogenase-like predicted oxidoreductase
MLNDALEVVYQFKEDGKIRFIGLSDWSSARVMKFIKLVNPDVIQTLYNVFDIGYETSGLKDYVKTNNLGVCFFSPIKHGILTGKYDSITDFPKGDFRKSVKEFQDIGFIKKMQINRKKIEEKFSRFENNAIMHALLGSILFDNPTGCALLGQRNESQAAAAGELSERITKEEASWVFSLYRS